MPKVKVVDVDTGQVVSEVDLPVNWPTGVLWMSEHEAICIADRIWRHFNYLTGRMVEQKAISVGSENALFNASAYAAEDGKTIYFIGVGMRGGTVGVETLDLDTGQWSKAIQTTLPRSTGNRRGLVPGGQYLYVGDPGLYIYDRQLMKLVTEKPFKDSDLLSIAFSPDGSCYAVATGNRIPVDDDLRFHDFRTQTLIRVHDSLSGNTLFAVPAPSRWVRQLVFSPDARRLAAVTDDGCVTVWELQSDKQE